MPEPFSRDHRPDYPVEWRGRRFHLSDVTIGIKEQYCQWLTQFMMAQALKIHGRGMPEFKAWQMEFFAAPPTWGVIPSAVVQSSMTGIDGQLQMFRLLLNIGPSEMPDAELLAMMAETSEDEGGAFHTAMSVLKENADPKVGKGAKPYTHPPTKSDPSLSTNHSGSTPTESAG